MKSALPQAELQARLLAIEPFLNAVAIFIMATLFLFWDASRAVYVLLSLAALFLSCPYWQMTYRTAGSIELPRGICYC
jgi:hypothetical protein